MNAAALRQAMPIAFASTLDRLRDLYAKEVSRLTDEFKPMLLDGWLRGWADHDGDRYPRTDEARLETLPPAWRLERLCERRSSWLGSEAGARAVAAACPARTVALARRRNGGISEASDVRTASEFLALDVLDEARRRGWRVPRPRRYAGVVADELHPTLRRRARRP